MWRDAWSWRRARSKPPPGCLWRLCRSASTLTEPFRPDGNVFCWCGCRRQSERSWMFWQWGGRGRWWWCRHRAWQAERCWQTGLGDEHNLQTGTAKHGEVLAEADEAKHIDTTGLRGCRRLHPWKRYEVRQVQIQGSGGCLTANGWWCSFTCTDNISSAYGLSCYCPRNIANAASDFLTRIWSTWAWFWEATVGKMYSWAWAHRGARFISYSECEACRTRKLLPLHIASPASSI